MNGGSPVLLVEDDVVDIMTVRRAFREAKVANPVHVAVNGEEALQYLRNEGKFADPKSAPEPCIILLDLNMPVMNGMELLKIIKADVKLRHIPVIVLTTSHEENDRMESYDLSVAGYIVKPVEFEKFVEAVKILDVYWSLNRFS